MKPREGRALDEEAVLRAHGRTALAELDGLGLSRYPGELVSTLYNLLMSELSHHTTICMSVVRIESLDVVIWFHSAADVSQAEWDVEMLAATQRLKSLGGVVRNRRGLVVSDLGAPNTRQRGEVRTKIWEDLPGGSNATAFTPMLDSAVKKGIAQALMWMQPSLKFMGAEDWHQGLRHVGLDTPAASRLLIDELHKLQQRMPPNRIFERILLASGASKESRTA